MSVELDESGLGRYRDLSLNPIYYYNAITFCGSSFYRKALGYEVIWDKKAEATLVNCLDYLLHKYEEDGDYYFEELKVKQDTRMHGEVWPRGLPPKTLTFAQQWPFELKRGETLTARINLLDKPYHVDLERSTGEVFSIHYPRYAIFRNKLCKVKGNARRESNKWRSKPPTNGPQGRKREGLSLVKQLSHEDPIKTIPNKLSSLRQRG